MANINRLRLIAEQSALANGGPGGLKRYRARIKKLQADEATVRKEQHRQFCKACKPVIANAMQLVNSTRNRKKLIK